MSKWNKQEGKTKRKHVAAKQAGQTAPKCQLVVRAQDSPNHQPDDAHQCQQDNAIQGIVSTNQSESENENFEDSDMESIDDVIDDTILDNCQSPVNNTGLGDDSQQGLDEPPLISPSMIAAVADDIFCKEYVMDPPLMHLPPVSETLADIITRWCQVPPKKEDIKAMFKHSLVPINVEGLFPVKINKPVYRKLPIKAKIADQKLRGLNTFIAHGMGPVLSIFHELCQIEAASKNVSDKTVVRFNSAKQLVIDEVKIDFGHMRTKMGHAMRLLATCHSILL